MFPLRAPGSCLVRPKIEQLCGVFFIVGSQAPAVHSLMPDFLPIRLKVQEGESQDLAIPRLVKLTLRKY